MPCSDVASAIDDSIGELLGVTSFTSDNYPRATYAANGNHSDHWTMSDNTVLKSAIDDFEGATAGTGRRGPKAVHTSTAARSRAIPGAALDRLVKANITDRKREQKRLETVVEVDADGFDVQGSNAADTRKQEKRGSDGKFYVPRLDDSLGIRIKNKAGQSEVIRKPSIPTLPIEAFDPPRRGRPEAKPAKVEPKRAPSPQPSVHSTQAPSIASERSNVIRIVGKDGKELFMPLPNVFGAQSTARAAQTAPKQPQPAKKETRAQDEKAKRDAKAAKAAKEVRFEREMADLRMSGARGKPEPNKASSAGSRRSSKSASEAGWEEMAGSATPSRTKCKSARKQQPDQEPNRPHKQDKAQKRHTRNKPEPKPKDKDKIPSPKQQQQKGNKPASWHEEQHEAKPWNEGSQQHDEGSQRASPSQRIEQWQEALPTAWRPPSVRTVSEGPVAPANEAVSQPPRSIRSISRESDAVNGRPEPTEPLGGWQQPGQTTYRPPSQRSAASGFREVGQGTYEPRRSHSDHAAFERGFGPQALPRTPSHSPQSWDPVGPPYAETAVLDNVYQNLPARASPAVRSHHSPPPMAPLYASPQPAPNIWFSQPGPDVRHSASVVSHQSIKQETSQHGGSPQVDNFYAPPASAHSKHSIKRETSAHSSHRQPSVRSENSVPYTSSAVSGEYVYPQHTRQVSPQQKDQSPQQGALQSPPGQQRRPSPLRQTWTPQQEGDSLHQQGSSRHRSNAQDPQSQGDRPTTVFAGHGWISPHPLSLSGSDISVDRERAIRIPAGHDLAGSRSSSHMGKPVMMTYSEWQAVREEQKTLSVRSQRNIGGGGSARSDRAGEEERTKREQFQAAWGGGTAEGRRKSNWSRTTSSHAREDQAEVSRNARAGWDLAGVGSVRSDGRVQLRMPWDQ